MAYYLKNKFFSAIYRLDLDLIKTLIQEEPHWLTWSGEGQETVLHYLCWNGTYGNPERADIILQVLKLLVGNGMDINAVRYNFSRDGRPPIPRAPLDDACYYGKDVTIYTWMLENGAVAIRNCMYSIASHDDVASAELFLQHGHSVNGDIDTLTPLMTAYGYRKFNIAKWLLVNGVNVNTVGYNGDSVLYYAIRDNHHLSHIKLLLQYGANPDLENKDGISPRKLAIEMNNKKLVRFLERL